MSGLEPDPSSRHVNAGQLTLPTPSRRRLPRHGRSGARSFQDGVGSRTLYWRYATFVAIALFAIIPMRLTELLGPLQRLKPVLLASGLLVPLLWSRTSAQVKKAMLQDPHVRLSVALFSVAVLGIPFALYSRQSAGMVWTIPFILLMAAVFLLVPPTPRSYDTVRRGICTVAVIYALAIAVTGRAVEGSRLTSGGSLDPNDIAAVLAPMACLALASVIRAGTPSGRLVALAMTGILAFVVARTGSRGGAIALGVGVVVYMLAQQLRRTAIVLLVTALLGAGMWRFGPESFRERMRSINALEEDYNVTSENGRLKLWSRGIHHAVNRPLFGVGMGNFPLAEGLYFQKRQIRGLSWNTAHNTLVQAFAEIGLVGGGILLALIGLALRRAWALYRRPSPTGPSTYLHRPEILAALMSYLVAIMFLSHAYSYMLYTLLGFVAYSHRANRLPLPTSRW